MTIPLTPLGTTLRKQKMTKACIVLFVLLFGLAGCWWPPDELITCRSNQELRGSIFSKSDGDHGRHAYCKDINLRRLKGKVERLEREMGHYHADERYGGDITFYVPGDDDTAYLPND